MLHDLRRDWKGIIAITRGGLVPAALVARELELRLIDTVCVVSYGAGRGRAPSRSRASSSWLKGVEGDGEGWLLIDDLVDTGRTARAVRERLPKAHFATLYAKPAGRPLVDTFVKEFKQEKWIYFPWDIDYQFVSPIKRAPRRAPDPRLDERPAHRRPPRPSPRLRLEHVTKRYGDAGRPTTTWR